MMRIPMAAVTDAGVPVIGWPIATPDSMLTDSSSSIHPDRGNQVQVQVAMNSAVDAGAWAIQPHPATPDST